MSDTIPNASRHHGALIALHWLSSILILAALVTGTFWLKGTPNSSPDKVILLRAHAILGITILVLILWQYAVRVLAPRPPPATTQNPWLDRIAAITHHGLYILPVAMAASGIVTAVLAGLLPILFGDSGASLPRTFDELAPRIAHGLFAKFVIGLISLHVLGTVYHHVFCKDHLLRRMWFGRRSLARQLLICTCVAIVVVEPTPANAHEHYGEVHFPVACSADVQEKFDLGLAMLHTFSFPAAAKVFTEISRHDTGCAMAYWGLGATAIGSLYGGRPGPMALQGELAVRKAKAIGGKTARERDYIATVEAFYRDADKIDYRARVRAYANALERLHRKYPDDREAEILFAYALSALGAPTDQTFAYQLKGAAILENLLVELPNHPGATHYLLHAYDNTPYASRGLTAALRLAKVAPSSPHALQFPAHIFVRMGLWQESIETNRVGAAVDDLFFKPHAMDFLVHSYLQTGQDASAKRVVDEAATIKIIPHILDAHAIAAMPARYAVERRRWDEAAALTLPQLRDFPWDGFPHAEAVLVFARALGAARSGGIDAVRKDLDRLQELRAKLIKANSEGSWQEYWVSEIENHRQIVMAWIAYATGRRDVGVQMLRAVAEREDSTEWDPVMPGHLISARQLLGEMLLDANTPQQAMREFEAALKIEPARFWSLQGVARAAELSGHQTKAEAFYALLVGQTASADGELRPALRAARAFLQQSGAGSTN
jgi:cytochrome b561/tetratricopeptide (TPR) repeat protein